MSMTADSLYLNDTWSIYFHDPFDDDWRNESYLRITGVSSAEDFWTFENIMADNISKGMFFLMREYIFPCWDDPANINGGCLSMKILKNDMPAFWQSIVSKMLCEKLLASDHRDKWDKVNGISTSPKKHFCIVKIWVGDESLSERALFDFPKEYQGEVIFKSNRTNISHCGVSPPRANPPIQAIK